MARPSLVQIIVAVIVCWNMFILHITNKNKANQDGSDDSLHNTKKIKRSYYGSTSSKDNEKMLRSDRTPRAVPLDQHCVVHVHGMHHSGTGFLRQTIKDGLLALPPDDNGKPHGVSQHVVPPYMAPESEGQHLQRVYPQFFQRPEYCLSDAILALQHRTNTLPIYQRQYGKLYYCPAMVQVLDEYQKKDDIVHSSSKNATDNGDEGLFDKLKERLQRNWYRHWDLEKYYLIQKTPTLDVLFLERMKLEPTVHVMVLGHPLLGHSVAGGKNINSIDMNAESIMTIWLDVWAHILEQLSLSPNDDEGKESSSSVVESYAVVNFETLILHQNEISQQMAALIHDECAQQQQVHRFTNNTSSETQKKNNDDDDTALLDEESMDNDEDYDDDNGEDGDNGGVDGDVEYDDDGSDADDTQYDDDAKYDDDGSGDEYDDDDKEGSRLQAVVLNNEGANEKRHQPQQNRRRLELHRTDDPSKYLKPKSSKLQRLHSCQARPACVAMMEDIKEVVTEFGYSWDEDALFDVEKFHKANSGAAHNSLFLFSSDNPPSASLVTKMKALSQKYTGVD